jgi:hypothetical protein
MLSWENTDQFGNLKVATSSATGLEDVEADLRDMSRTVFEQHGEDVMFSVDVSYAEVSAPKGDQVSHLLNLPFVSGLIAGGMPKSEVQQTLTNMLVGIVGETAKVVGPWD